MVNDIRKRLLTPKDGQAIVGLHDAVRPVGERHYIDYWRWKYQENPMGKNFCYVAEADGKIVAQNALIPCWIDINGKKVISSQSADSLTNPAYTRRGLFSSLARESYALAASEGVKVMYGIPNEEVLPLFLKLGWIDAGQLPCLVKIISHKSLFISDLKRLPLLLKVLAPQALFRKHGIYHRRGITKIWIEITKRFNWSLLRSQKGSHAPQSRAIKIESITTFDNRFDDLWSKVKDTMPITTWRDSNYLNWRYSSPTDEKYAIFAAEEDNILVGFIVATCWREKREGTNTGCIVDFLCLPDKREVMLPLTSSAIDYAKKQGMDTIMCHAFECSPFYQFLREQGFIPYGPGCVVILRKNTPDCSPDILDIKRWHLMEGDIDTY